MKVFSKLLKLMSIAAIATFSVVVNAQTSPTIIKIAHSQNYVPYDFVNEKGESDGFEVQVFKEIDKLLPEYEFKFYPTSEDDLFIGIDTGKYDVAIKGAWYTKQRAEKLILPKEKLGASIIGIAFRTADKDKIKDLNSFAEFSGKLVPIPPESAQWSIIEEFNQENPTTQIKLIPSDVFIIADAYQWVLEGRYDAFFDLKVAFEKKVTAKDGVYHNLVNDLSYVPYLSVPTYPMFNKKHQELATKYEEAIRTLESNGTLEQISMQYFGENIFLYVKDKK